MYFKRTKDINVFINQEGCIFFLVWISMNLIFLSPNCLWNLPLSLSPKVFPHLFFLFLVDKLRPSEFVYSPIECLQKRVLVSHRWSQRHNNCQVLFFKPEAQLTLEDSNDANRLNILNDWLLTSSYCIILGIILVYCSAELFVCWYRSDLASNVEECVKKSNTTSLCQLWAYW